MLAGIKLEYGDVFQGIGTLPGGPYRIQLKEGYNPVQHPPRQVAVSLKPPYKAELERLTQLGVIKEHRLEPSVRRTLFTWESSQRTAFEAIKKENTIAPVLAYFDQSKASTIQSDASKKGLGDDKPVIYASRALTKTEQSYSNIERELLSVVFALERFHHYVYGYTATVQTDHKPLVSVWKKSIVCNSPRLQRLLLRLSQYDVNIECLKGKDNVVADALSRVSPQPTTKEGEDEEYFIPVHMLTEEIPADSTRVGHFRRATAEDTISGLLMQLVANGWPELKKDCHPLLVDYWSYREEISAENGLLFKGHRLIIPQKFRSRVLQTIHEGHFAFEKMQLRAREAVFWLGITSDLLQTAQGCEVCQTFSRRQQRETMLPHEVPWGPWKKLRIDFFEFQSTTYLLIADYYSSHRYSQSNDFIERMVQTVKQCMRKCAAAGHDPNLAMLIYRATPLTTSIPSPAELLNGRKYRALLPTKSPIQNPHYQVVREQMVKDKSKMCEHYNKTAKDLPSLPLNQRVYVQIHPQYNQWTPATVTKTPVASQPKSYSVETTKGAQLVRNRRFICPAQEITPVPADRMKRGDNKRSKRPRRVIARPKRLIEAI
ncbi:Retrovirus-related Pol polyprotein from transposon 17.6 [Stylophora pistillata]|uniref:Retrovirus-related Pol polyprotein from transposon 17.6 n=1 Tax=Stylophora pistillata TaxID=50429 RepID=A0A2B4RSD7_STYPI|nr:Retrovirus-related Pol polyprotein from transposon 17.6 [Stylophora pistillata]